VLGLLDDALGLVGVGVRGVEARMEQVGQQARDVRVGDDGLLDVGVAEIQTGSRPSGVTS
jgi:hypothetical protein